MPNSRIARSLSYLSLEAFEERLTPSSTTTTAPYALGLPNGVAGDVVVYNSDGSVDYQIPDPYGANFTGGVRVALAVVNGDGVPDLITAPGPGTAPVIYVYSGVNQQSIDSFDAYDSTFTGGVNVVAADLNGDGKAEIITGADNGGGPRVRVFDGASVSSGSTTPTTLDDFLGITDPNFRGGVRLGLGDINGDGVPDLVVAAGNGGGPRVAIYDGADLGKGEQVKLVNDFYAFDPGLRNGVYVSVGDLTGTGTGDLIFGAGPGGGPRVTAFSGKGLLSGQFNVLANFFAGSTNSRDGVEVGTLSSGGTTSIVATDLSTNSSDLFDRTGASHGSIEGRSGVGGPLQGLPGGWSGNTPIPVTSATATAVEATYSGSGAGTLITYPEGGGSPTSSMPNATISLAVTSATLDTPRPGAISTSVYGLTITGTITVTITGQPALSLSISGQFNLTSSTAVQGMFTLGEFEGGLGPTASSPNQGVMLTGSLANGTITLKQFSVYTYSRAGGGFSYYSPATRNGIPIALTSTTSSAG